MHNDTKEGLHERFMLPIYSDLKSTEGKVELQAATDAEMAHSLSDTALDIDDGIATSTKSKSLDDETALEIYNNEFHDAKEAGPHPKSQNARATSPIVTDPAREHIETNARTLKTSAPVQDGGGDTHMTGAATVDVGVDFTVNVEVDILSEKVPLTHEEETRQISDEPDGSFQVVAGIEIQEQLLDEHLNAIEEATQPETSSSMPPGLHDSPKSAGPSAVISSTADAEERMNYVEIMNSNSPKTDHALQRDIDKPVPDAVNPIDSMMPTAQHSESPGPSAISYLLWLQQRQTRFPTMQPLWPECVALGQRLGRSSHKVFDEVLYHWGLETESQRGEYNRTHRLEVLRHDLVFFEHGGWF